MSRHQLYPKLPLYGPLEIKDFKQFYKQCKESFFRTFNSALHSDTAIKNYDTVAILGRGAFGTVRLVVKKNTEEYYAVKVQNKQKIKENESKHRVHIEKRVLCSLDFPFCVRMEHYCHDKEAVYFLMPFVRGGELYTLIKKFGFFHTSMTRFYAAQVVLALEFFQYIHFVYRDLKPENILVDHTGFLKITDYGLVKEVDSRTYTICGTPPYMAPEVVEGNGYARSADWWSLGILIFEMASGRPPFVAKNTVKLFTKIMYAPVPMYNVFSPTLKHLLRGLLSKDVTVRLGNLKDGAEDVKKHPWFKKVDWVRLLSRQVHPPYIPDSSGPADTSNFPYAARAANKTQSREDHSFRQEFDKTKVDEKTKDKHKSKGKRLFTSHACLDDSIFLSFSQ